MCSDILKHQNMVRNNIMKSFGAETSEDSLEKSFEDEVNPFEMEAYKSELTKAELDEFEKAKHQDGDMHPNGRWVWRQSANGGKGDWRVANPKRGGGSRAASAVKTTSSEGDKSANKTYETKTTSKKDSKSKIDFKDVKGVGERYSFDLKKSDDKDKNELFDRIKDHFRFDNNKRGDKWSNSNVDDYIYKDKNGNYVVNVLNRLGNSGVYGEIANRIYNSDVRIVFNKNGKKWIATEHERRYYGLPNIERKLNFNFL